MRIYRRCTAVASLAVITGVMLLTMALGSAQSLLAQASAIASTSLPSHAVPASWAGTYVSSQNYKPQSDKNDKPQNSKSPQKDSGGGFNVRYTLEIPGHDPAAAVRFHFVSSLDPKKTSSEKDDAMHCELRLRNRTQLQVLFAGYADGRSEDQAFKKGDLLLTLHRAETAGRVEYTATPGRVRFEDKHWIIFTKK
jgi:hypothetical protein